MVHLKSSHVINISALDLPDIMETAKEASLFVVSDSKNVCNVYNKGKIKVGTFTLDGKISFDVNNQVYDLLSSVANDK